MKRKLQIVGSTINEQLKLRLFIIIHQSFWLRRAQYLVQKPNIFENTVIL